MQETRATVGPILTQTETGTTFRGRVRCGSPLLHRKRILTLTGMAAGSRTPATDMSGRRVIPGAGRHFDAVAGRTGTPLAGAGHRAQAAGAQDGALVTVRIMACTSSTSANPRRTIVFRRDRCMSPVCSIPFQSAALHGNRARRFITRMSLVSSPVFPSSRCVRSATHPRLEVTA